MALASVTVRLLLAILFARAAWHKSHQRLQFQNELDAYQLLPASLLRYAVFILVIAEFTCVLLLAISPTHGLILTAVMLLVYGLAMGLNLLKGRTNIDCGCTSFLATKKNISWPLVGRNIMLAAIAILAIQPGILVLNTGNVMIVVAATVSLLLAYEAAEQALANTQRHQQWLAQHPQRS